MKKIIFPILFLFMMAGTAPAGEETGESFSFSWAFFLKDGSGTIRSLAFDTPEEVAGGDLLRIYLELRDKTYVYLYLFDSMEDLYLVFPPDPGFYGGEFPVWHKSYIPSGRNWFTLDDSKGSEKFFLLAANRRLEDLEDLTGRFLADRDDPERQDELLRNLQQKIELFSTTGGFDSVPVPVRHGKWLGIFKPEALLDARTISTKRNYGVILELVNK